MSQKDPKAYLYDILQEIVRLKKFTSGFKDANDFATDITAVYASCRSIEIIGEAAKNMPQDLKKKNPHIPWKLIIGMRDKLIHDYGGTDVSIVWKSVTEDAPNLEEPVRKIFDSIKDEK